MRYRFLFGWMLGMLLSVAASAQVNCPLSSGPASGCPEPIQAFIVGTNIKVDVLCVGQVVRFEVCNAPTSDVLLQFYPSRVSATNLPDCNGTIPGTTPYPVTAAGDFTVFANVKGPPFLFFLRNYRVVDSPTPSFSVAPCSGNNALITLLPGSNYDSYFASFAGGPQQVPLTKNGTTVVATNGSRDLTVEGRYTDNSLCTGSLNKTVDVLDAPQPFFFTRLTQARTAAQTATLTVSGIQPGYLYTVVQDDASGSHDIGTVPANATSFALPGPASGCYSLRRTDICLQQPLPSPPICALNLTATPNPGQNVLTFNFSGASAAASYRIERNGTLLPATVPGTAASYSDADVICGSSYTYRVIATLGSGQESVSNESTAVAILSNAPLPIPTLVASFTLNNTVELTPTLAVALPAGSKLRYYKSGASLPFATTINSRVVGDSTALDSLRQAPPCYTAIFEDVCGRLSDQSAATCPALLSATAADADGNSVNLNWSNFTGPDPAAPTTYVLQRLAPDGTVLSTQPVSRSPYTDLQPPTDRQILRYRLQISGAGIPAGSFSYSNVATVARQLRIRIPTAFTPNGDGLNDVLEVKGRFLQDYSFVVVDRNGQEVFRGSQRADTWDGRIKGHAPVNGSYVWRFQQTDETGKFIRETGTITILQ